MSTLTKLDLLKPAIEAAGFTLVSASTGLMDSGLAEFSNGTAAVKIVRDRSQWFVDAPRQTLEQFGLWRAFDSTEDFRDTLVLYLASFKT